MGKLKVPIATADNSITSSKTSKKRTVKGDSHSSESSPSHKVQQQKYNKIIIQPTERETLLNASCSTTPSTLSSPAKDTLFSYSSITESFVQPSELAKSPTVDQTAASTNKICNILSDDSDSQTINHTKNQEPDNISLLKNRSLKILLTTGKHHLDNSAVSSDSIDNCDPHFASRNTQESTGKHITAAQEVKHIDERGIRYKGDGQSDPSSIESWSPEHSQAKIATISNSKNKGKLQHLSPLASESIENSDLLNYTLGHKRELNSTVEDRDLYNEPDMIPKQVLGKLAPLGGTGLQPLQPISDSRLGSSVSRGVIGKSPMYPLGRLAMDVEDQKNLGSIDTGVKKRLGATLKSMDVSILILQGLFE